MFKFTVILALVSAASAADITLYLGRNLNCGSGNRQICRNIPANTCCGDQTKRYSSTRWDGVVSTSYGRNYAPSGNRNSCGQVGGITGADYGPNPRKRSVAGDGGEDCMKPDVAILDGKHFAINGDVPEDVTEAIYQMQLANAAADDAIAQFGAYLFSGIHSAPTGPSSQIFLLELAFAAEHVKATSAYLNIMAATISLPEILENITSATGAAAQGLPESSALLPPKDGITLLDTKNDIFLAYLQALALRNLNVIRSIKHGSDSGEAQKLSEDITKKLVEHRVYLERGVKPLESKIKYQVDKVMRAAEDEERSERQKAKAGAQSKPKSKADDAEKDSDEEESSDEDEEDAIDAAAYRPNPASFAATASASEDANAARRQKSKEDGVYRPPRISATAMPTTEAREKKDRSRPERSRTLDEYVSQELSGAPMAEPSIGSTITAGGRKTKSDKQQREEAERTAYEETNLVRLPKESKKERAKKAAKERQGGGFGGEEWKGLGDSLDRIGDLTRRKGGKDSALEKSRKRNFVEDGPRGSGIGDAFETKRRRMEKKAGRK
ncbi:hypothetical protein KC327_g16775 [Hortaea werneckii]|nr:hypothetical protein KC358_g16855 [Hortaea werneckii]KAI6900475.1 hypothetical protein KC348_g16819 [Hortaea werneckii]KAI6919757.1 hypothetical protein KC341_g17054 [Hortaea werneckii]KAI6953748.1 hypothetical protein KC321_g16765 [Hortaea werneckii]KAI7011112.1 hypothetical protein KC366_g16906 [Hortaea werneckii]